MLPELDGFRVLETLRARGARSTPVLVLTARGDEADKVRGLESGADDYVTKPFASAGAAGPGGGAAPAERRPSRDPSSAAPRARFGDVELDPATREVTPRRHPVALRPKEYDLLHALARREGRLATRERAAT